MGVLSGLRSVFLICAPHGVVSSFAGRTGLSSLICSWGSVPACCPWNAYMQVGAGDLDIAIATWLTEGPPFTHDAVSATEGIAVGGLR
jgi:hypothetical protein